MIMIMAMMMMIMMVMMMKNNDDDDDHDDGADDTTAHRPPARLHGSPSAPAVPENPTELTPPIVPISLSRPRKSDPPPDRSLKYNLRQHPVPSKKYQ